jgi:phosphoglucomutase
MSRVLTTPTTPVSGQKPGTSGLRKKTRVFMQPHYLENYVQSIFDAVSELARADYAGQTLIVGGDGRYYNRTAIQTIIRMAAANGFGKVLVGCGGILSTPAMSAAIRRRSALGGILLSASHNPGGIDADFGIKYNIGNGGPAPEGVTNLIYRRTQVIDRFLTIDSPAIDIDRRGDSFLGKTAVSVIDPLEDYTAVMRELFDFDALRRLFDGGFRILFDAMHGVTGPYARHIFGELLGAGEGSVMNGEPLEDFGGHHPDPNLVHAASLVARMAEPGAPDLGAACDGDGDRNLILGQKFFVTPGDSLALIAEHAQSSIPGYRSGLAGIARSMPTSTAVDRVARALSVPVYETPTGWKYFGNLMDAGLCTICGEESFGTGSNHVREKDGLWAVLAWLSILAASRKSVGGVVEEHWRRFGRSYFQRHDFEALDSAAASAMIDDVVAGLPALVGREFGGLKVLDADDFRYTDPVDGSVTEHQGIRIMLEGGSRVVARLSGTGTEGATLRLYLDRYSADGADPLDQVVQPLLTAALDLLEIRKRCGRDQATVVT